MPCGLAYKATSFLLIAYHQNLVLSALRLELPYTLFQIKSITLGIVLELSVLYAGSLPRRKSLS